MFKSNLLVSLKLTPLKWQTSRVNRQIGTKIAEFKKTQQIEIPEQINVIKLFDEAVKWFAVKEQVSPGRALYLKSEYEKFLEPIRKAFDNEAKHPVIEALNNYRKSMYYFFRDSKTSQGQAIKGGAEYIGALI